MRYSDNYMTTTYTTDTFETFPTNWTVGAGNGGTFTKVSDQKHSGSYSACSISIASASYAYAYKNFTATTGNYHVQIFIRLDSTVTGYYGIQIAESYDGSVVPWRIGVYYHNNKWYLICGDPTGTYTDVCELSTDVFIQIDIYYVKATGVLHIYVDSVKQGGDWTTGVIANKNFNRIYIGDVSGTGTQYNGKLWYDDLLIDDEAEPSPPPAAGQHCCLDGLTYIIG